MSSAAVYNYQPTIEMGDTSLKIACVWPFCGEHSVQKAVSTTPEPKRKHAEVRPDMSEEELEALNRRLEALNAKERVEWALRQFGNRLIMTTSFGVQSAALLHLANSVKPGLPVVFIDTGYLFPETYRFAEEIKKKLNLNLKTYRAHRSPAQQEALDGKRWEKGLEELEAYNYENKVEPMERALEELQVEGWMSGLRRVQSSSRAHLRPVEIQNGVIKIHPIIDWNNRDVYRYLRANGLRYHPLFDQGYVSLGDLHSTKKLEEGMTEEETRFNGLKRECGLHTSRGKLDFMSK